MLMKLKSAVFSCAISEKALPLQQDTWKNEIRFVGMAQHGGHTAEHSRAHRHWHLAGAARSADGVAEQALHRCDHLDGQQGGYCGNDSILGSYGGGGHLAAPGVLLHDHLGIYPTDERHPTAHLQQSVQKADV